MAVRRGTRRQPRPGRLLALCLMVVLAVLGSAGTAQAHAFLAGSNPADGQVLAAAPRELTLSFSESVALDATRIDVTDGTGRHVPVTQLHLVSSSEDGDAEEPVQVVAALPELGRGTYRISWETLSSDDLHRTNGVIVFGVQQQVAAGASSEPMPRPDESALRWLVLLGVSLALGGALARALFRRGDPARAGWVVARTERYAVSGAMGAAAIATLLLADQLVRGGLGLDGLLSSGYAGRWAVRESGLLLLVATSLSGRLAWPRAARRVLLAAGAALTGVGTALLGHSGAGVSVSPTRVVATAAHLDAATTWAGTVMVLALVTAHGLRTRQLTGADVRAALRRFGPPAAGCVGVMVVTGVYLSSAVVGSVDAALLTVYGRTLLLKVAVAGVAGALALANTLRLHGRRAATARLPRRTLVAEGVAAVLALGLTAFLTSGQPALEPQLVRSSAQAFTGPVDRQVGDLQEALSVRPNRPGPNVALVDVFDTRRPSPAPVRAVSVTVVSASGSRSPAVPAESLGDGRWSAPLQLAAQGAVRLEVTVRRPALPATTTSYRWTVTATPTPARPATVSNAPVGPVLRSVSIALAVLVLLAWLVALLRWRRRRSRSRLPLLRPAVSTRGASVPARAPERETVGASGAVAADQPAGVGRP